MQVPGWLTTLLIFAACKLVAHSCIYLLKAYSLVGQLCNVANVFLGMRSPALLPVTQECPYDDVQGQVGCIASDAYVGRRCYGARLESTTTQQQAIALPQLHSYSLTALVAPLNIIGAVAPCVHQCEQRCSSRRAPAQVLSASSSWLQRLPYPCTTNHC